MDGYFIQISEVCIVQLSKIAFVKLHPQHAEGDEHRRVCAIEIFADGKSFNLYGERANALWNVLKERAVPTMKFEDV